MLRYPLAWTLAFAAAFAVESAASVWVLDKAGGPGANFTTAAAAMAAVQDGDTLLVRAGSYDAFKLAGKGLTVIADAPPGGVSFRGDFNVNSISGLATPQQRVQVRGVRFIQGLRISSAAGSVLFEDCRFDTDTGSQSPTDTTVRVDQCLSVIARGCTFVGKNTAVVAMQFQQGTPALRVLAARLSLFDCTVTGGNGKAAVEFPVSISAFPGIDACVVANGQVIAQSCTVKGGFGGGGIDSSEPGGADVPGAAGGDAFALSANSIVWTSTDCVVAGGAAGGTSPGLPQPPAGKDYDIEAGSAHVPMPSSGRELTASSPIRALQQGTLAFAGDPNDSVLLLGSAQQNSTLTPWLSGNFVLVGGILPFGTLVLPASGVLSLAAVVPALPPGVDSALLVLQGGFLPTSGPAVLGAPSHLVVLSPTF